MWKIGQRVTVHGHDEHKCVVKRCQHECHRIIATAQRSKFREAKEKLPEGYYLVGDDIGDVSRA